MTKPRAKKAFNAATEFPVSFVTEFKTGEVYVYPGIGPMTCKGIESISVTGMGDVKTIALEETHARMPRTVRTPEAKMKASGLRHLADEATLDAVMEKLAAADGSGFQFKNSNQIRIRYEEMVSSVDLGVVSELICKTLGIHDKKSETYKGRASLGMEYGNRALTMLVREYALVKNIDIAEAEQIVTDKSGKHGRAAEAAAPANDELSVRIS